MNAVRGAPYEWRMISSPEAIDDLAGEWRGLDGASQLFARHEWHRAAATHLLRESGPSYVRISEGDRPVAIVPVFQDEAPIPLLGRVEAISSGFNAHVPFFDFPVAANACVGAIAGALEDAMRHLRCDALVWRRLAHDGNALRVARALGGPAASLMPKRVCPFIETRRGYDAVMECISKNLRANLRKASRKLEEGGGVRFTSETGLPHDDPAARDRMRAAYEIFLAIEASGWKGREGTGSAIALNAPERAFYAALIDSASPSFLPEIEILWQGERPLAAQYSLQVNGIKHALKAAYDEEQKRNSPGHVLLAHIVETACARGLAGMSLVTENPWLDAWRPRRDPAYGAVRLRSRAKGALVRGYLAVKPYIAREQPGKAAPPGLSPKADEASGSA